MEIIKTNCIVIGGGVAGLAVAKKLSFQIDDIFLIEKDNYIGNGISSRNSEVIHAGIYYKPDSLKNKFIVEGKNLLYKYLDESLHGSFGVLCLNVLQWLSNLHNMHILIDTSTTQLC